MKKQQKIILGISGEIASGKDAVREYLVEKYGATHMGFSDILRSVLDRLSLPYTRANMANLGEGLRNTFGEDVLAQVIAANVEKQSGELVVVDGVRKWGEYERMRQVPGFRLLFVDTSLRTRYERIIQRSENPDDHTKTFEEFVKDNEHQADIFIRELKAKTDFVVDNNGTLKELKAQVDAIMEKLRT